MSLKKRPQGKDATTAALLDAADYLFGEKGPSAVTVREISAYAKVNHALLHRHFGSKEALLDAIIERHMWKSKKAIGEAASPDEALSNLLAYLISSPAFPRIFAHLILEHRPLNEFVRKNGGTADIASFLERFAVRADNATSYAAILVAFSLGWALFKKLTAYAASCESRNQDLDRKAMEVMRLLVAEISSVAAGKKTNEEAQTVGNQKANRRNTAALKPN